MKATIVSLGYNEWAVKLEAGINITFPATGFIHAAAICRAINRPDSANAMYEACEKQLVSNVEDFASVTSYTEGIKIEVLTKV